MSRESLLHVKVTVDIMELKIKIIVDWERQLHNHTETSNKYRIEGKLDDCLMLTAIMRVCMSLPGMSLLTYNKYEGGRA